MLEQENKSLEEKLQMVQKMMELEKAKRPTAETGTIWRSATTNQPIQGYSQAVLDSMKN